MKNNENKKPKNTVVTDPIADMLTRIRNAIQARHENCLVPHSKIKAEIAKILIEEGYIDSIENIEDSIGRPFIKVNFKLHDGKQRVIQGLRRISKPGLRVYAKVEELPRVMSGLGIAVISTSKGIMTDRAARSANLGGEVLAYIY
ncbi:MAG: 30S ribosomal protein S8 [Firmicutes bacterium]|nr:30S ribosomal protein S8 [Bacillota bacterium]